MSFPSDSYVFGSAHYRPVIDSLPTRTPVPRPLIVGEWTHIAYSSTNIFETDGGRTHTSWQVRLVMPTKADYDLMSGYVSTFQTLTADFFAPPARSQGNVLLRSLEGAQQQSNAFSEGAGSYTATATFEWAS